MNPSHDELIQRVLDGDASPEERTRLDALMQREPEIRLRHEAMAAVFAALGSGELEDAPADLRDSVLRSLPANAPAAVDRAGPSRRPRAAAWPWARLALPLSAAAAAVLLIVVTLRSVPSPFAPDARTAATMSGSPPHAVLFELGGKAVGVHVAASRDEHGAGRLGLTADAPATVLVSSAHGAIEFSTIDDGGAPATAQDRLELELRPGAETRVRCAASQPGSVIGVRATRPGVPTAEIRIHLESLPTLPTP